MTQIELITNDQKLTISGRPVIASGDKNTVQIKVCFDPAWEGFAKSATFFTEADRDTKYEIVLNDNMCVVPHEVLADPGIIHIGVRGIKADTDATKTSDLVSYRIKQGASEGTNIGTPPTPSMYQQLLDKVAKLDDEAVKSVNGQKPDEHGNVSVSGGGGGGGVSPEELNEAVSKALGELNPVTSVNGAEADKDGNVNIEIPNLITDEDVIKLQSALQ